MKKGLGAYITVWLLLVSLFNVICFVTPETALGYDKFGGAFWAGYGFIMAAFAIHLFVSCVSLSAEGTNKRALNMPLNIIAWAELLVMLILGAVCMLVPNTPNWLGIIICYAVLVFSVILMLSAKTVGNKTDAANSALNDKTALLRELTASASLLKSAAKTPLAKQYATKVYEALRYSDPVSAPQSAEIESIIALKLEAFSGIICGDDKAVSTAAEELLVLIDKRETICKAAKK